MSTETGIGLLYLVFINGIYGTVLGFRLSDLPSKGRVRYQEETVEGADALSLLPLGKKSALGNSVADVWHT